MSKSRSVQKMPGFFDTSSDGSAWAGAPLSIRRISSHASHDFVREFEGYQMRADMTNRWEIADEYYDCR